ncbi:MAG: HEAT repeat domain-containing protein [Gemmataceae bacterium]
MKGKPSLTAALAELAAGNNVDRPAACDTLRQALVAKQLDQVAESIRLIGKLELKELEPELVAAFHDLARRRMNAGSGQAAKTEANRTYGMQEALIKVIQQLGLRQVDVYVDGAHTVAASLPGQIDKGAPLRIAAAQALVEIGGHQAIDTYLHLLHDDVIDVRATAVHCLVSVAPHQVGLLLRYLTAIERESTVLEQCFTGLLDLDPERGVELVAGFLEHGDDGIRTSAALALGETRRPAAFEALQKRWHVAHQADERTMLLQAIAIVRIDASMAFLLGLIREGDAAAGDAIAALSPFRGVETIRAAVEQAAVASGQAKLIELYRRKFRAHG